MTYDVCGQKGPYFNIFQPHCLQMFTVLQCFTVVIMLYLLPKKLDCLGSLVLQRRGVFVAGARGAGHGSPSRKSWGDFVGLALPGCRNEQISGCSNVEATKRGTERDFLEYPLVN